MKEKKVRALIIEFFVGLLNVGGQQLIMINNNDNEGSKRRQLVQHAHSSGLHAFTQALASTQLQPLCAKRQLSYYRFWSHIFILKVPEGRGVNQ